MRYKDIPIESGTDEGNGGFTGYAATFDREPDCYGDVIAPGAFDETLKEWAESGKPVPLLYDHNMYDPDYNIGIAALSVDERGLLTEASFDGSAKAQRVRQLVREGRLYKMSFAFDVLDEGTVELADGRKANELRRLRLYEVSVVLVPANGHAEIVEAKARSKYGAAISKANGDEIAKAAAALESIGEAAHDALEILKPLIPDGSVPPDDEGGEDGDEGEAGEDPQGNQAAKSRAIAEELKKLIR
ncbi:HK97 family phage prohead protease [Collinsella ihumii]|uniref:HK97 family phage prohead protease n=1 Tax=Collinsella ihumii TaxID=1720204 RepID=A0ABT7XFM0_9ACTN|nr:HK97 family phage prohead protease [Collinsella ihumii]MDN0055629.1 HK97 family phage prohead protease [Collinsella ihumii]MDN0064212.1 HK97 family phage prohead protease [Collinsella ihumii]